MNNKKKSLINRDKIGNLGSLSELTDDLRKNIPEDDYDGIAEAVDSYWNCILDAYILESLNKYKDKYEKGDKFFLMLAIKTCAEFSVDLPEWVKNNFIDSYNKIINAQYKSWDEVFGKPFKSGSHIAAIEKKKKYQFKVWAAIQIHLIDNPTAAIDAQLFETIGQKFNLGKTLTSDYYYSVINGVDSEFLDDMKSRIFP